MSVSTFYDIALYCDDIEATIEDLTARVVDFEKPVGNHGYGLMTYIFAPGDIKIQQYQPFYKYAGPTAATCR